MDLNFGMCSQVGLGRRTETEMMPPVGRLEGDTEAAYAAATQQFQQGQMELSGGNMGAATHAFRAACHFNPSAAAYTFMAWMQRLVSSLLGWYFCNLKIEVRYMVEVRLSVFIDLEEYHWSCLCFISPSYLR